MLKPSRCWLNGRVVPDTEAVVSVFDHGLLYGDGVFEGIRFYHGNAFKLREHLARLYKSAQAILLQIPYTAAELECAVAETIAAYGGGQGYLRLVVTRGVGLLGLDPTSCIQPTVFMLAAPLALVREEDRARGIPVIIASTRRLAPDGLDPRIKSLNYLNHILARIEANCAGVPEAVMLNHAGKVAEGTADNVFIVRDGIIMTPPGCDGALDGITRGVIFDLAQKQGILVRELSLGPYDLYTADEVFLTGTGAELIPVRSVDGRPMAVCPGPVFRILLADFQSLTERS